MSQTARNQTAYCDDSLWGKWYPIHDHDPVFTWQFDAIFLCVGVKSKKPPPELNGYMESFIKTFKAESLDRLIPTSKTQLRYVVREFLIYCNRERPHSGLGGKMIRPWPQDEGRRGRPVQ